MYDVLIIGCGPCGLTASIYASCFHLNHTVIGKILGGQMSLAPDILNYPGFDDISGKELAEKMANQVKKRGIEIITDAVGKIEKTEQGFNVQTESGKNFETKTIILATGTERRKLNVKGENEYLGKGVIYCSPCEKVQYENKIIAVVGGANSALSTAVEAAKGASKVYIIYRGSELRADPVWMERLKNNPKIEILYKTAVSEISGDGQKITGVNLKSTDNVMPEKILAIDTLYIEIGGIPGSALVAPLGVDIDKKGFIKTNENLETNVPGVFAAGDVVNSKLSIEQIASAVGLGSKAAMSVYQYLKGEKSPTLWGKSEIKR